MKITYTGRHVEFPAFQVEKIEGQFSKLSKLLDGGGEREAHVVISHERHLHHAEVTVNYHHHALVGLASDADLFTAVHDAVGKLEKQALKVRAKWRDGKRSGNARDILNEPEIDLASPAGQNAATDTKKPIQRSPGRSEV